MIQTVDARPTTVNLKLYAGDDLHLKIIVLGDDGNLVDLTGVFARAQIRATTEDTEVIAEFVGTVDDAVYLQLDADDTALLPEDAVWDCQLSFADLTTATIAAGSVTTAKEVTR